jgi:RelA/SpoT family (p)ppGpp synthetase
MVSTLTSNTPTNLQSLFDSLAEITPGDKVLIERAYHKAENAHAGQVRKSGEPYFTHCVAVAQILADMRLDAEAIAAALMHDIVEDTPVTVEELRDEFGNTVASMVAGVTKLKSLPLSVESKPRNRNADRELEYIRKMLLTMGDDVRVVLIKLADRLHNMRTLGYMSPEKQRTIAQETMDIFAPLANRLGIWQIKWELEDLSFRYLDPEAYKQLAAALDERRTDREAYMASVIETLRKALGEALITNAMISGRPKHIYSISKKMQRKQTSFDQIYDVRAVRVIVQTIPVCYLALGVVHNLWRPIPGEFDDYIAAPKDNFYQSLHTAVLDNNGKTVEVQIRTWDMHEHAEYGIAAHWRYKEGQKGKDENFERRLTYLRRLMEFGPEVEDAEAFIESMKSDVFQDRVYAFTPKGDIIDLPASATPIDFAYHIHTDIGHRCRGAKVHGRLVPLNYQLRTGDQVEILTYKRGGPSMDWLNTNLGYVKTARALEKIKHWFRKQNREKHISMGRETLERELKRLGLLDVMSYEAVAQLFNHSKPEDFLAAVGAGDINSSQITHRILEAEQRRQQEADEGALLKPKHKISGTITDSAQGVQIMGTGGLLVTFGKCCNPTPGDPIVGYVTRGRGVTVHRRDCLNLASLNEPERLLAVSWGHVTKEQRYSVPVEVIAYDREGLLRDISTVITDEKVNMSTVNVHTRNDIAVFHVTLEIADVKQLARVLDKISTVSNVVEARRRNVMK